MRIEVRVRPGASRTRVGGRYGTGQGAALVVAVASPAVEGAANEALVAAIARAFGVRPRQVTLVRGTWARSKLVELDIDPVEGRERLEALLGP